MGNVSIAILHSLLQYKTNDNSKDVNYLCNVQMAQNTSSVTELPFSSKRSRVYDVTMATLSIVMPATCFVICTI